MLRPRSRRLPLARAAALALLVAVAGACGGARGGAGGSGRDTSARADAASDAGDASPPRADDGSAGRDSVAPPGVDTGILDPRVAPVAAWPYVFEDDEVREEFAWFRAEGLSFEELAPHVLDYARKASVKVFGAPSAALAHFEDQRALAAALAGRDEAAGAASRATIGLVGDLMWIRSGWDRFADPALLASMAAADAWVGNLESPIDRSQSVPTLVPEYRDFNAAPGLVRSFVRPDGAPLFSALSFANNHTLDREDAGAGATLAFLDEAGVPSIGVRESDARPRWVTLEVRGVRLGLYATSWGLNEPERLGTTALELQVVPGLAPPGRAPVDLSGVRAVLAEMTAAGVELRVLVLHWGHEYEYYPSALQARVARELVAAGADVIVGAHPHVPQPDEICFVNGYEARYADAGLGELAALRPPGGCLLTDETGRPRKALVLHSLGNFVTAMPTFLCQVGLLRRLVVYRDPSGAADWQVPRWRLVYNDGRGGPEGGHRTSLLDDWLAAGCGGAGCDAAVAEQVAFLRGHLGAALEEE